MNILLQVGYSAASILWARTPPGRWDKNISIRVVLDVLDSSIRELVGEMFFISLEIDI